MCIRKWTEEKCRQTIPEADCMKKYIQGPYFYAVFLKKNKTGHWNRNWKKVIESGRNGNLT